jgi:hypothetical protein
MSLLAACSLLASVGALPSVLTVSACLRVFAVAGLTKFVSNGLGDLLASILVWPVKVIARLCSPRSLIVPSPACILTQFGCGQPIRACAVACACVRAMLSV